MVSETPAATQVDGAIGDEIRAYTIVADSGNSRITSGYGQLGTGGGHYIYVVPAWEYTSIVCVSNGGYYRQGERPSSTRSISLERPGW